MQSKWLLLVKAAIAIVVAIFMLFLPVTFLNWFLKSPLPAQLPEPAASITGLAELGFRYFGALMAGVAILCYFASSATASVLRKKVILSLGITDTIGFILALVAQLSGKFNAAGWILVALWFLLALFLLYFFFTEQTD